MNITHVKPFVAQRVKSASAKLRTPCRTSSEDAATARLRNFDEKTYQLIYRCQSTLRVPELSDINKPPPPPPPPRRQPP